MKLIGETIEGEDVYELTDKYSVSESGEIFVNDESGFFDTDYVTTMNPKRAGKEEIKETIYNPSNIKINGFTIDLINNKINGEEYKYIDIEDGELDEKKVTDQEMRFIVDNEAVEFVNHKGNFLIFNKFDEYVIEVLDTESKEEIEVIAMAMNGDIKEFISLEMVEYKEG